MPGNGTPPGGRLAGRVPGVVPLLGGTAGDGCGGGTVRASLSGTVSAARKSCSRLTFHSFELGAWKDTLYVRLDASNESMNASVSDPLLRFTSTRWPTAKMGVSPERAAGTDAAGGAAGTDSDSAGAAGVVRRGGISGSAARAVGDLDEGAVPDDMPALDVPAADDVAKSAGRGSLCPLAHHAALR